MISSNAFHRLSKCTKFMGQIGKIAIGASENDFCDVLAVCQVHSVDGDRKVDRVFAWNRRGHDDELQAIFFRDLLPLCCRSPRNARTTSGRRSWHNSSSIEGTALGGILSPSISRASGSPHAVVLSGAKSSASASVLYLDGEQKGLVFRGIGGSAPPLPKFSLHCRWSGVVPHGILLRRSSVGRHCDLAFIESVTRSTLTSA